MYKRTLHFEAKCSFRNYSYSQYLSYVNDLFLIRQG